MWSHRLSLICWYLHKYHCLNSPSMDACGTQCVRLRWKVRTQVFLHLFKSSLSPHQTSAHIQQTANMPASFQLDSHAARPEDMQSALSRYKASAALTNMQVQSCSTSKGFSMILWLEEFGLCNFWFSFWDFLSSSGNFAKGKIGRSWNTIWLILWDDENPWNFHRNTASGFQDILSCMTDQRVI